MTAFDNRKFGFLKPAIDAHTIGVHTAAELLEDCGYETIIADGHIEKAFNDYKYEIPRRVVVDWVINNQIDMLGISYRLDEKDALDMLGYLIEDLKKQKLMRFQGGPVEGLFFGGLPKACEAIDRVFDGLVITFKGGESATETLSKLQVPQERIPKEIIQGSQYDESLLKFGRDIIKTQGYLKYQATNRDKYPEFGTKRDTILKRVESNQKHNYGPVIRAHVGPYSSQATRKESVDEFINWVDILARSNYLDVLSIGSSQLSQSNFGENWQNKTNGGGVPINSPQEYQMVYDASRPLLVRTYAGTKNIPKLAKMYEETINISWHALSLWWFNKLDGRGPYDLYTSLKEHVETIQYIATTSKPFEANVSHHFAFRGADDVTYIVSGYLAAKIAKKNGIKTFVLQNMLNTPRLTWGVQDLAKSRALLKLVKSLEDDNFKVLLQTRAGLDYFKPDIEEAKAQLAAVSALMDDIDPYNPHSPEIIHVVSYSEASHLATPDIINESIQITQHSILKYRDLKKKGEVEDMGKNPEVKERSENLYQSSLKVIGAIENNIKDAYTPEGFYKIFATGFLPVPYLWNEVDEFEHARNWKTKPINGSVKIVDEDNKVMDSEIMIQIALGNLKDAERLLAHRQLSDKNKIIF